MHAVDTNVLVRLITRDDEKQVSSAEAFVARGAWVSHLVLAETIWVLATAYDLNDKAIAKAVEMLLDHQHVSLEDTEVVINALDNYRQKPQVSFSDCLVLEIARKAGHLPLGTFDKSLGSRDGAERL